MLEISGVSILGLGKNPSGLWEIEVEKIKGNGQMNILKENIILGIY